MMMSDMYSITPFDASILDGVKTFALVGPEHSGTSNLFYYMLDHCNLHCLSGVDLKRWISLDKKVVIHHVGPVINKNPRSFESNGQPIASKSPLKQEIVIHEKQEHVLKSNQAGVFDLLNVGGIGQLIAMLRVCKSEPQCKGVAKFRCMADLENWQDQFDVTFDAIFDFSKPGINCDMKYTITPTSLDVHLGEFGFKEIRRHLNFFAVPLMDKKVMLEKKQVAPVEKQVLSTNDTSTTVKLKNTAVVTGSSVENECLETQLNVVPIHEACSSTIHTKQINPVSLADNPASITTTAVDHDDSVEASNSTCSTEMPLKDALLDSKPNITLTPTSTSSVNVIATVGTSTTTAPPIVQQDTTPSQANLQPHTCVFHFPTVPKEIEIKIKFN